MKLYSVCLLVTFLCLVCSCSVNRRLDSALDFAGDNRGELETVLEYYRDSALKYEAACFLIENMPKYYSYKGWLLDTLRSLRKSSDVNGFIDDEKLAKWGSYDFSILDKVYDAHVITAAYLIHNIDQAFCQWRGRTWNKELSFNDFCELILPYRIGNEPLENWRNSYSDRYSFLLDSVYTGGDILEATNTVLRYLEKEGFKYNNDLKTPHLGASFLLENRIGKCVDSCDLNVYVMRSLGIPVTVDCYLYSSDSRTGHTWNVLRDTTGRYLSLGDGELTRTSKYSDGRKKGKVFRECFGMQSEKFSGISQDENVPKLFRHRFLKDVSDQYFDKNCELKLEGVKDRYAYLGVFHTGGSWEGIDMEPMKDDKVSFKNVEPDGVYAPLIYNKNSYHPVGYPFFFDGDKAHFYIPDFTVLDTVRLMRKNTLYKWVKDCLNTVLGARFEIANRRDFINSQCFYCVNDTPKINYTKVQLSQPIKGRYVKYLPDRMMRTEMAELAFFEKGWPIVPIKVEGLMPERPRLKVDNVIDGDPLTYFRSLEQGTPIVLDFGREVCFDEFMYMPKNDDNFIRIGDMYELFYHSGIQGWESLGRQQASAPYLIYDNLPKGALFYLRDLTRGVEEQVFHIRNGKQVFISNLIDRN